MEDHHAQVAHHGGHYLAVKTAWESNNRRRPLPDAGPDVGRQCENDSRRMDAGLVTRPFWPSRTSRPNRSTAIGARPANIEFGHVDPTPKLELACIPPKIRPLSPETDS